MTVQEYELTKINISDLHFDETNPNQLTKEQEQALKKAMKRFGYLVPIVINENYEIGDGEHRAKLYKEMGLTEIPAYIVPKINDDIERRLLRQTMNKLRGEHEIKMDADEIALIFQNNKLNDLTELLATQRDELENILTKHKGIQFQHEDNFDVDKELEDLVPVTELGDIWQLGNHRIICADCSDERSIKKLMEGKKADMVFTDPPYAIFGSSTGVKSEVSDVNMIKPFFKMLGKLLAEQTKPRGHVYVCCDWRTYPTIKEQIEQYLQIKNNIVWSKGEAGYSGSFYSNTYENIVFFVNEPQTHSMFNSYNEKDTPDHRQIYSSNVWDEKRVPIKDREHFAEKPISLSIMAIKNSTDENELVFDPFLGSGTTLMASQQTNRICRGVEIDPRYIDIIIKRYQGLTGKDAVRLKDNKTYNKLKSSE